MTKTIGRAPLLRVALIPFVILALAWGAASLWFPFGWDHGIFAIVGDTVLRGGMPYRDSFEPRGPLAFLVFAALQLVFGRTQVGIRVFDLSVLVIATWLLGRAIARLTARSAGVWAAVALVLAYASQTFFHTAQFDGAVSLLLIPVLAPFFEERQTIRQTLRAGLLVGGFTLIKPFFIVYLSLPLVSVLFMSEEAPAQRIRRAVMMCVATALPIVAVITWFLWRGALGDLVDVHLRYAIENYSGVTNLNPVARVKGIVKHFLTVPLEFAVPFVLFGALTLWRRQRRAFVVASGWFLIGIALVGLQGKFFIYHWVVILPPTVLLGAIGIDSMLHPGTSRTNASRVVAMHVLAYVATMAVLLPLTVQPARDARNWLRYIGGIDSQATYYLSFTPPSLIGFAPRDEIAAADYLRAAASAGDAIVDFGYDTPATYLSGLTVVSRFTYDGPLLSLLPKRSVQDAFRKEFLAAVDRARPRFVLVGFQDGNKSILLARFPEFSDYVARHYVLEKTFGEIDIYRRTESEAAR